jgi:hypothetical protein
MNWAIKKLSADRKYDFTKIAGLVGEKIVANMLSHDYRVEFSMDPYGAFDLVAHGQDGPGGLDMLYTIQVKTTTPYLNFNSWVVEDHGTGINIDRIFQADLLYIVNMPFYNAPSQYHPHKTDKCIVWIKTKDLSIDRDVKFINGKRCFALDRDNPNVHISRKLTLEEERLLYKYATSYFA